MISGGQARIELLEDGRQRRAVFRVEYDPDRDVRPEGAGCTQRVEAADMGTDQEYPAAQVHRPVKFFEALEPMSKRQRLSVRKYTRSSVTEANVWK